jgi:hypothetical protein
MVCEKYFSSYDIGVNPIVPWGKLQREKIKTKAQLRMGHGLSQAQN